MAARGSYRNLVCLVGVLIISRTLQPAHGTSYPQCLPDAVPESERKSLVGEQGLYPIGIWVNDWPAGYVTAAVVRILLAEKIGFNTVERGPGPSTVDSGFRYYVSIYFSACFTCVFWPLECSLLWSFYLTGFWMFCVVSASIPGRILCPHRLRDSNQRSGSKKFENAFGNRIGCTSHK